MTSIMNGPFRPEHVVVRTEIGKDQFERFYEFKKQQFVMCVIPKVASTSLSTMFMSLARFEFGNIPIRVGRY